MSSLLALAACGGASPAKPPPPPPREVEILTLQPLPVRDSGEYLGTLISRASVNVLPQLSGFVRKIHVKPGQKVEVGSPLVDIDAREEDAALESAVAQRSSAETNVELAKQTLTRTEALYHEGLVSASELERARSAMQAADAATRAAGASVSQRQVQVAFKTIKAVVPGIVGEVPIRVGDFVNAGRLLTSIAQAAVLEVTLAVPASRVHNLPADAPIEILDAAGNVIAKTTVFYVAPQSDPDTQLVAVKGVFENTVGLRPSEIVRTRLVYGERSAIQVPMLSVVRQSGQAFVFAVTDKDGKTIVERKPVTLGALGKQSYVVDVGLKAGDRIATSSIQSLRDGTAVTAKAPKTASAEPAPAETAAAAAPGTSSAPSR